MIGTLGYLIFLCFLPVAVYAYLLYSGNKKW